MKDSHGCYDITFTQSTENTALLSTIFVLFSQFLLPCSLWLPLYPSVPFPILVCTPPFYKTTVDIALLARGAGPTDLKSGSFAFIHCFKTYKCLLIYRLRWELLNAFQ